MDYKTCEFSYIGSGAGDGGCPEMFRVPEMVDGAVVTAVAPRAFDGCRGLRQVILPETVTTVGAYAFAECRELEKVRFPDGVAEIGDYAFYNCMGLHEVVLGKGIVSIGYGAFKNCLELNKVSMVIIAGQSHCLGAILQDEFQAVDVAIRYLDGQGVEVSKARLLFTDYQYEYVPEIEARQFNWETYGSGESYRVSIRGADIDYLKYDSVFPVAMVEDDAQTLLRIVAGRLCYPHGLTGDYRVKYEAWLTTHMDQALSAVMGRDQNFDMGPELLDYIIKHRLLDDQGMHRAMALSQRCGRPEITAQLMAYGGKAADGSAEQNIRARFAL